MMTPCPAPGARAIARLKSPRHVAFGDFHQLCLLFIGDQVDIQLRKLYLLIIYVDDLLNHPWNRSVSQFFFHKTCPVDDR